MTEAAGITSSTAKGETLEDTIRIFAGYELDAIIMRHTEAGASHRAAAVSPIPIINAGDGAGEHPTQALLDLYTILRLARKEELVLTLCGDLSHSRTVRSLCRLIISYGSPPVVRLFLASPEGIQLGEDIRTELREAGINYAPTTDLARILPRTDVFYQTRVQRERFENSLDGAIAYNQTTKHFALTAQNVATMPPGAVVLHPLPRLGELPPEVDADPRAKYFEQASNGLYIRMALLERLLRSDPNS